MVVVAVFFSEIMILKLIQILKQFVTSQNRGKLLHIIIFSKFEEFLLAKGFSKSNVFYLMYFFQRKYRTKL